VAPPVTIGLPCYGRPEVMAQALASLLSQTFRDFTLLIHENPSGSDHIRDLVLRMAGDDPRVVYHRHNANLGITENFLSLLAACRTEYFMWAADDDLRHPKALETLLALMESRPQAALAGFSVEVINTKDETIDFHTGFSRFSTGDDREGGLARFLAEPEIMGKANLFYGLFRAAALRDVFAAFENRFPTCWGPDFVVLAALIARYEVVATDRVLIRKRTNKARASPLAKRFPMDYGCPAGERQAYVEATLAAMPDEMMRDLARAALDHRMRHLASPISRIRRGILKALRLECAPVTRPATPDGWSNNR
jgi:glycosyltransferase involved in cell wall biosynthesis